MDAPAAKTIGDTIGDVRGGLPDEEQAEIRAFALEVPKGTMIVLHGLLPHWSAPNRSAQSRHAYTLHIVERDAVYPDDNWLRRPPELPLRGF